MKICISSTGDNIDSSVIKIWKMPFLLIYDDGTENYEFISNSSECNGRCRDTGSTGSHFKVWKQ